MQDNPGEALANSILRRLLSRAENSKKTDQDGGLKPVSLRFSQATIPEYFLLDRHADKAQCNARMRALAAQNIVVLDWDGRAGSMQQLLRVTLKNGDLLAKELDVVPRWQLLGRAKAAFEPALEQFPVLLQVLETWARGRSARGTDPGETGPWLQAIQVIDGCTAIASGEMPVRRLSASLFGNSKVVESLASVIDALQVGGLAGESRDAEDIFADIGLVKFPSTMLLAGEIHISYGGSPLEVRRPYVGLAPGKIEALLSSQPVSLVLSIENLTTFHEMAAERPPGAWLLYTGGMPGPAWCNAYKTLLSGLPRTTGIYHWGDIDRGGFRIASRLSACCEAINIRLELHNMVGSRVEPVQSYKRLSTSDRADMLAICRRWRWANEEDGITEEAFEQESMKITWPHGDLLLI